MPEKIFIQRLALYLKSSTNLVIDFKVDDPGSTCQQIEALKKLFEKPQSEGTSEENKAIAQTILNQLGGIRLLTTMIGAKNYTFDENLVGFRYMNAERNNSNHIQIHL